mmetsp:Transcript_23731/g.65946  ORF Transcript_23731/g.65946 Transcript_23731/m.65946 type:complete len:283 (-) Transcript_23731:162-1010(-)
MTMSVVAKKAIMVLQTPWPLLGLWLVGGVLAVFVPVGKWKNASKRYYRYYGKAVEYENNQRAYEQAQKQYENQQNGNYQYVPQDCKWWQVQCRKENYYYWMANEGGNNDRYRQSLPDWYLTLGGKMGEEMDREREEEGLSSDEASGAIKFVYTISILTFVGVLAYGSYVIYKKTPATSLYISLGFLGLFSFAQMVLITQGVIATDDRELENSVYGWFGQLAVLMVYTNYAFVLFSIIFAAIFGIKAFVEYKFLGTDAAQPETTEDSKVVGETPTDEDYKPMA